MDGYSRRGLVIVTGGLALALLSGCSGQFGDNGSDALHDRTSNPSLIGEHRYACDDGSDVDADFLADGLTLEITRLPGGEPERLTAPATGLIFVGHKLNVSILDGGILILREGASPQRCRRLRRSGQNATHQSIRRGPNG